MSGSKLAPDGKPFPLPRVLVDTSEQTPIAFGRHAAPWGPGAPVHHDQLDATKLAHPLFARLGERTGMAYPWPCKRANLGEGDYQLEDPRTGEALPAFCAVETKRKDLVSSLTWGHDRLEAEFQRLKPYRFRALVAQVSAEALVGLGPGKQPTGAVGKEASLMGSILALSVRYGVPIQLMPNALVAEYMTAWILADAWKVALSEDAGLLAEVRRLEALDAAHGRPVAGYPEQPPRARRTYDPGEGDVRRRREVAKRAAGGGR